MSDWDVVNTQSTGEGGEWSVVSTKPASSKLQVIEPELESNAMLAAKGTAGMLMGAAGQLSDMFTGIIGGVARLPYYVGARTSALAQTGDQKLSAQAAAMGAEEVLPEEIHAPFRKIARTLGPEAERFYNENPIGQINTWISELITKGSEKGASKTGIPSEDLMQGMDALMTFAGVKGTKVSLLKAIKERDAVKIAAETKRAQAEAAAAQAARQEAQTGAVAQSLREARLPVQQHINEVLGVKTPQQRAAEHAARAKDIKAAMRDPAEGSDYVDIDESIFRAEERGRQSAAYEGQQQRDTSTVYDTTPAAAEPNARPFLPVEELSPAAKFREGARILQTPPAERTLADIARLRRLREGGSANPELLGLLGVAGLGAAAGVALSDDDLRGAVLGTAAGAAATLPFMGRGAGVTQRMGQTGAVKGPGGMWHPEAVERLAEPLKEKLTQGVGIPLLGARELADLPDVTARENAQVAQRSKTVEMRKPLVDWADKAIQRYLNKHAGTPTDPLKDIEIPFGEGTARWEDLTDRAIRNRPKGDLHYLNKDWKPLVNADKIPSTETIWNLPNEAERVVGSGEIQEGTRHYVKALESYLSHVGDYLRQNVDPAKLSQYDLVRAVKETAANDARVAKQMEKAAADTTKQLPVYKDYGDGFKWVELKLPEKLTEEQAKGVRKAEKSGQEMAGYEAIGPDGKPIVNSYTQEKAWGRNPEEAYLAGRLAEEGNQMGHCVGGYCEGVASGESKIYSLRDAKGKSHVTVEVEPQRNSDLLGELPSGERTGIPDILQIKGKQNRAPDSKYLPYVQDFVKSGKWGDVQDLGNAGLQRLGDNVDIGVNSKLWGQKFATMAEISEAVEKGELQPNAPAATRVQQRGSIDQQLLIGMGAIGLGGLIGSQLSEEPGTGALLGALAGSILGLPGGRQRAKKAIEGADYLTGALSTRIKNIAPEVMFRAREFERVTMQRSHDLLNRAVPWMKALNSLAPEDRARLSRAVLTNDPEAIAALQKGNPELVSGWREVRNILTQLGTELADFGRFRMMKGEYFPRLVKDYEGLMGALDQPVRTRIESAIATADATAMKSRGTPLTDIERSAIVNKELSTYRRSQGMQPGYAKKRSIEDVTEQLQPFYHTPEESLFAYIRGAVTDLEMAKFFGKDLIQTEKAGQKYTNIDQSVGNYVGKLLAEGKLDASQQRALEDLLKARFRAGERSPNQLIQEARNLINMGLLGNAVSAATQLGDVAMPIYAQGLRATMTAMARQLTGNKRISAKDFGLADHLAEEFVGASKTAEALNKTFKYSGFSMVDRFGKDVMLNAALSRYERLSRTPKGGKQIAAKYEKLFGNELPDLITDLRSGQITPRVRALLFSELSDFQPISKLEVPQGYLENPNGRFIYMLKTFMLKQFDIVRRDAYNEIKTGDPKRIAIGLKNLTAYSATLGIAGATADMVKNWLMGRDTTLEAGDVMENVLKTFGWSEYTREQFKKSPVKAIANSIMPPIQMMDHLLTADPKAVQYIPVIGKLYYNWELGGREDSEIRESVKARKEGREFELSSRAEQRKEQKRQKAEEKREKENR